MGQETETLAHKVGDIKLEEREDAKVDDIEKFHDDDGKVPLDPIKMNKTLEWDYICKYEPWDELPCTYYPFPRINHRPPFFVFGFGFHTEELAEFSIRMGYSPTRDEVNHDIMRVMTFPSHAIDRLRRIIVSEFGVHMTLASPWSLEADIVLVLWNNYCKTIPHPGPKIMLKLIDRMMEMLKEGGIERDPKWYIAKNENFDTDSYNSPADFTRYFPAQAD